MKYVIINGSPRRKNTWKMVMQAKTNLKGDFEEIHLMKEKIPLCNGCFKCIVEDEEKCPHRDKVKPIVDKMMAADGIIVACPVYAMNVTALLKNFLDHTAYFYHRPEFFTKKALVVVSTAGAGQKDVAKYIDETLGIGESTRSTKSPMPAEERIRLMQKASMRFHKNSQGMSNQANCIILNWEISYFMMFGKRWHIQKTQ